MLDTYVAEVDIRAPVTEVFEFATTPRNWPLFWALTVGVTGDVEKSLAAGSRCTEHVRVAYWNGFFEWHGDSHVAPSSFAMTAISRGGGPLGWLTSGIPTRITYALTETDGTTHFRREMTYTQSHWLLELADKLFMRRAITNQIENALHKMTAIIEAARQAEGRL
nr:hypothetical protein Hi04_10k_c5653_00023 [uncultured bacterium]